MHAESGEKAVGTPTGAPTWPPCVASIAGLVQVFGAQEPGRNGLQPELPGPHASTVPPPVTRQPSPAAADATLAPKSNATASAAAATAARDLTIGPACRMPSSEAPPWRAASVPPTPRHQPATGPLSAMFGASAIGEIIVDLARRLLDASATAERGLRGYVNGVAGTPASPSPTADPWPRSS